VAERGNRRVVSMGRGRGYVERPYRVGGRDYRMRTYYYGGRRYASVYRGYYWHGRPYYRYAPGYYYRPAYYGWAYNPWPAPVYYRWGWYGDPWYRYYGYYYAPYPSYPSGHLWMTDYILAENLRLAYEAQHAGLRPSRSSYFVLASATTPQLSPEVKQLLAEEVKSQIAAERAEALGQGGGSDAERPPASQDPAHRVFLVFSDLSVTTDDGQECSLSAGDIIRRANKPSTDENTVAVKVASSKKGDCAVGSTASLDAADVDEMQNHLREQIDVGLKQLAESQGKNGLPAAPDTSTTAAAGVPPPTPDADVDSELRSVEGEADQAEKEVAQGSAGSGR
jgi:hypothetical protein